MELPLNGMEGSEDEKEAKLDVCPRRNVLVTVGCSSTWV